jgi:hypothetical protein
MKRTTLTLARAGRFAIWLGVGAPIAVLLAASCVPTIAANTIECPPFQDFKSVSPLLEQRCGTLDCHGNDARPLRLYGQYGLRFLTEDDDPDVIFTGNLNAPTTPTELERNYFSVCGIEPEKLVMVELGDATADSLTLVRKPRLAEKHKGGRIWDQGKAEDRCLVGWINGDYAPGEMDLGDCNDARGIE